MLPGGRPSEFELIFFHASKLQSIQIEFPTDFVPAGHVVSIDVTERSNSYAMLKMLGAVYRSDRDAGTDPTRIFRKSVKRLVLHGRERFTTKLIRDYHRQEAAHHHVGDAYAAWINAVEDASLPGPGDVARALAAMVSRPLISVVVPVYDVDEVFLRACIDSVLAQSYPHWELCIADDASPKPHVRQVLEEYRARDSRIRVVFREQNGDISRASNSALEIAHGEFVALLDHDDTLAEHALFFMAVAINETPNAQVLYSDEDKIDDRGNRSDPHFKCDWNPDLLLSQNYVSHLGVYRRELLNRIGGFRIGVEGSQDHDLLLRCIAHIRPDQLVHIPRVLYHWRTVVGSTALASDQKDYTTLAGLLALRDHFAAEGSPDIEVEAGLVPNTYRVRYPTPTPPPLVSLLIPTRDRIELLEPCLRSILDKTSYRNFEILVLDNESVSASTHAYFDRIQAEDPRVRVLPYHHPFNYSAINNYGAYHANGDVLGLLNNDVEVITSDWLTEMISHASRPEIGCVGAKLYYDDDTIQHAGVILGIGGVAGHSHKYFARNAHGYFSRLKLIQGISAVTGACLVVRKAVFDQVGGLNENLHVAFNDVDFCLKVRAAGYRNLWTPYAELYHHESKSRGAEDTPEKQARFKSEVSQMLTTWADELTSDPFYSPNLTRSREDFSINTGFAGR